MNKISILLLFLILPLGATEFRTTGLILRVVDGDTFHARLRDGRKLKIRLLGVDTPESYTTRYGYKEYLGKQASSFVRNILNKRNVVFHFQTRRNQRIQSGRYGRALAFITINGRDLGEILLQKGYASVYRKIRSARHSRYVLLEQHAKHQQLGIWNHALSRKYYRNLYQKSGDDRLILWFWKNDRRYLSNLLKQKGN